MGDGTSPGSAYDLNGIIRSLTRQGLYNGTKTTIDQLGYTYNTGSNRLLKVIDAQTTDYQLGDFNNGSSGSSNDYDYDANGNLVKDGNKGISAISYNILNLPEQITVTGKGIIVYGYDAAGTKLSKTVTEGAKTTRTLYLGGMIFENDTLRHIATAEGRLRPVTPTATTFVYDYFLKDHLGNVRAMIDQNGTVMEETHYYPFGLIQKGISYENTSYLGNKFKFNRGNELQAGEFAGNVGLELYDALNRLYDPQLGRFWQIDELAEANWEWTPYNFAINNPISFNDPLGLKEGPNDVKTLEEVTVVAARGLWGKRNLYYQLLRNNINIDRIANNSLRESMQNIRKIVNFSQKVAEQTRKDDEAFIEGATFVGSFFVPVGWLTKAKYAKWALRLLKLKRGLTGFKALKYAAQFGIKSYRELKKLSPAGSQVHHLIEKRFADLMEQKAGEMASIVVTETEHQVFTNAWRAKIGYEGSKAATTTLNATREQVENAARVIYKEYPEILKALGL
ncbi:hypothetical protein GCM10027051_32430 [Niabella terrae]